MDVFIDDDLQPASLVQEDEPMNIDQGLGIEIDVSGLDWWHMHGLIKQQSQSNEIRARALISQPDYHVSDLY